MKKDANLANEDSDPEMKSSEMSVPDDPVEDPLKWLDEGLPDLFGYSHHEFDLALQFDIERYADILADSVSDSRKTTSERLGKEKEQIPHTRLKETAANTLAPAKEWGRW